MSKKGSNSVDFLNQVLGMLEWVKQGSGVNNNSAVKNSAMENKLEMALNQLQEKDQQLKLALEENSKLDENCKKLQTQVQCLQGQLEREKWERCHAEINLREISREMSRVYERIDEVIKIVGDNEKEESENLEEDDEVQVIGIKRRCTENSPGYEQIWKKLAELKSMMEEKWKKCEEFEQETRKELEKAKGFVQRIKKMIRQKVELEQEGRKLENEKKLMTQEETQMSKEVQIATTEPENKEQNLMEVNTNLEKNHIAPNIQMEVKPSSALLSPPVQPTLLTENSTMTLTFHQKTTTPEARPSKETEKCMIAVADQQAQIAVTVPENQNQNRMELDTNLEKQGQMEVEPSLVLLTPPVQESSTMTLTFHQTTPSPEHRTPKETEKDGIPNSKEHIKHAESNAEFFRKLLGLPIKSTEKRGQSEQANTSKSSVIRFAQMQREHHDQQQICGTPTPPIPPVIQKPPAIFNQPTTAVRTSFLAAINQKPPGTINQPITIEHANFVPATANRKSPDTTKQPIKSVVHGVDTNKSHLGFFCLCGLECSNKKTLQYHLQGRNSRVALPQQQMPQNNPTTPKYSYKNKILSEQLSKQPQNTKPKKCRKCGKMYTGGKDGLRKHILEEHAPRMSTVNGYQVHKLIRQNNPVDRFKIQANPSLFTEQQYPQEAYHFPQQQYNIPQNDMLILQCDHCPELFRTMVQLKLHQKVRHTSAHIPVV